MTAFDSELLDDLLDRWEEARENGKQITAEELCQRSPELLPILKSRIERLLKLDQVLDQPTGDWIEDNSTEKAPVTNVEISSVFNKFELIDHGGLGHVYEAVDSELNREAAVKFLQRRHLTSDQVVKKFRDEAEITGRLAHPGIVSIYGFGKTDKEQPFYVMQRVHGDTLADRVRSYYETIEGRQPTREERVQFRQLLASFVAICRTMMYAHRRGVVHADLKPKNIVIGKHGETIVLDWGLATTVGKDEHHQNSEEITIRLQEPGSENDSSGTGAGTLGYMSPEQHSGLPIGTPSDIYALGATLYFILTGKPAFDPRQSAPKLRTKVIRGDFEPPRAGNRDLSPQLDAICCKAMSLVASDRYKTADELGDDVERYFADEPVTAYPETAFARLLRWLRHHRDIAQLVILGATAVITTLAVYSLVATSLAHREHRAFQVAERARNHSLELAAKFAADSVARRTTERWRILEFEAATSELVAIMATIDADPAGVEAHWSDLSDFLRRTKDDFDDVAGHPESWFITDASGRQVARFPASDKSIGKPFAHRDYFHGNGRDLPPGTKGDPIHIRQPYKSHPYVSSATNTLKIALTVPIWSQREITPDRRFLGVIGMAISLGEFREVQVNLRPGQNIMVVKQDESYLDSQTRRGLVLYHPALQATSNANSLVNAAGVKPHYLDTNSLQRMQQAIEQQTLIEGFRDPFADSNAEWIAAASPVVTHQGDATADQNWVVVVAECVDLLNKGD